MLRDEFYILLLYEIIAEISSGWKVLVSFKYLTSNLGFSSNLFVPFSSAGFLTLGFFSSFLISVFLFFSFLPRSFSISIF